MQQRRTDPSLCVQEFTKQNNECEGGQEDKPTRTCAHTTCHINVKCEQSCVGSLDPCDRYCCRLSKVLLIIGCLHCVVDVGL